MRKANIQALQWVDNIPREKWTKVFDGGQRWGHMTINLVESMNSVLKTTHNLPITALVKSTYYRLGTLIGKIGHEWTKMLGFGQMYTTNCMKGIEEEVIRSNSHKVMQFDRQRFCFLVQEIMKL